MRSEKSNSSLFLIELIIVILFFSICSAINMQVFASAKQLSAGSNALSRGAIEVESIAEIYKAANADLDAIARFTNGERMGEDTVLLYFDQNWDKTHNDPKYLILLNSDPDGSAQITVYSISADKSTPNIEILSLPVKVVI